MPKSRRSHRRPQPQKRKFTPAPAVTPEQPVAQTTQAAPAPKLAATARGAAVGAPQYPFIGAEMRGIGIVSGIIIVLLVILYFVVP